MKLTKQQGYLIAGGLVAALGLVALSRKRPPSKLKAIFRPGESVTLVSGAMITFELPGGTYDLLGTDAPSDIIVMSTTRKGDVTQVTLLAPDTPVPYTVTPTWVNIHDPSKRYSLKITVEPSGAAA